ncbi:glycosyltransferase [Sphingorhabdus sp. 109]|uniref:glycosyltransferase n=1 Tax=Sphingorhabdus sp. 109 TaxID=2653173 RepID=UPI0022A6A0C4|nr:glycosyltransferase [Sphingorhabdus sp. 109]
MKILFHLSQFNIGGAEMSTLRLLNALEARGARITLVLTERGGALVDRLAPSIKIVHLRPGLRSENPAVRMLRGGLGALAALRLALRRYDGAAVGMTGAPTWVIRHVVRASNKLHFVRNDLSQLSRSQDIVNRVRRNLHAFTSYVCVSDVARQSLVAAVPEVADKVHVVYNILDPDEMRARARAEPPPFPPRRDGALRIISVCRLHEKAKGLTRMTQVARRLLDAGLDFDWFVLGDGPNRDHIEAEIAARDLGRHVHLLGRIENPFPAYAECDLVAMLSNYEGLCGVVNEAKIMGKPIVATRVSGVDEQLVHGETGLIAEQDADSIFDAMHKLMKDDALRETLSNDRLPAALLDDAHKLDMIELLFSGKVSK